MFSLDELCVYINTLYLLKLSKHIPYMDWKEPMVHTSFCHSKAIPIRTLYYRCKVTLGKPFRCQAEAFQATGQPCFSYGVAKGLASLSPWWRNATCLVRQDQQSHLGKFFQSTKHWNIGHSHAAQNKHIQISPIPKYPSISIGPYYYEMRLVSRR